MEQRQKQENRKRRKQQHDKKKQQQKYRDAAGLLPNTDKFEKKHKQESYADKVKNLFVGVQQVVDDGGETNSVCSYCTFIIHAFLLI